MGKVRVSSLPSRMSVRTRSSFDSSSLGRVGVSVTAGFARLALIFSASSRIQSSAARELWRASAVLYGSGHGNTTVYVLSENGTEKDCWTEFEVFRGRVQGAS